MTIDVSMTCIIMISFFFSNTATTEIYTLSLHDALPIFDRRAVEECIVTQQQAAAPEQLHGPIEILGERLLVGIDEHRVRSEEHTSELQSHHDLVCRLLLEKKKFNTKNFGKLNDTT